MKSPKFIIVLILAISIGVAIVISSFIPLLTGQKVEGVYLEVIEGIVVAVIAIIASYMAAKEG